MLLTNFIKDSTSELKGVELKQASQSAEVLLVAEIETLSNTKIQVKQPSTNTKNKMVASAYFSELTDILTRVSESIKELEIDDVDKYACWLVFCEEFYPISLSLEQIKKSYLPVFIQSSDFNIDEIKDDELMIDKGLASMFRKAAIKSRLDLSRFVKAAMFISSFNQPELVEDYLNLDTNNETEAVLESLTSLVFSSLIA